MLTDQHPITPPPELVEQWREEADKQLPTYSDLLARPKPLGLAEQALEALDQADKGLNESEWQQRSDTIRRALERLQELEEGND